MSLICCVRERVVRKESMGYPAPQTPVFNGKNMHYLHSIDATKVKPTGQDGLRGQSLHEMAYVTVKGRNQTYCTPTLFTRSVQRLEISFVTAERRNQILYISLDKICICHSLLYMKISEVYSVHNV